MQDTRKRKKVLKPVPKAVLLKSVRKDEVKQRDLYRKSRLEALLNELEEQEPKERKTLCLMIQIGIDDIVDIGVDGEIDTIEDLKQKLEDRCKFAIATLYVKITGQWARLCPCDVIKNVIRVDDDLMAVPCERRNRKLGFQRSEVVPSSHSCCSQQHRQRQRSRSERSQRGHPQQHCRSPSLSLMEPVHGTFPDRLYQWDASSGKGKNRKWRSYEPMINEQINAAYQRGDERVNAVIHDVPYVIDLHTSHQINANSGNTRSIRSQ